MKVISIKTFIFATLLTLSPVASFGNASAGEANASEVDLDLVNANIQRIIDSSFKPNDLIEAVSLKLNPKKADLERLKIQAVATASGKSSPWAPKKGSTLKLTLKTNTGKPNSKNESTVTADAAIALQTQVFPLVQFFSAKAYKRINEWEDPSHEAEIEALKAVLKQMQSVTSLAELAPQLFEMIRLLYVIDPTLEPFLKSIDTATKMVDGRVESIEIRLNDPVNLGRPLEKGVLKKIFLKLDEQTLQVGFTFAGLVPTDVFEQGKKDWLEALLAIQNFEPSMIDNLKRYLAIFAEWAEDILDDIF